MQKLDGRSIEALRSETSRMAREGVAAQTADALRAWIIEGRIAPGARLAEERIRESLGVSRSTLREAYQLLIRERLLVHHLSRGVFVRRLTVDDLHDLYRVRRFIESAAVRARTDPSPDALGQMSDAVAAGAAGREDGNWRAVVAANIRFHQGLVALVGSPRLDEIFGRAMAEFRLFYLDLMDHERIENPYVERNAEILEALREERGEDAAALLDAYFDDAEAELTTGLATSDVR